MGKDIKTRSAQDQLSKLQGASSLEDIEEAFSLEQLSREFFQAITKHFTHLYENIKFPKDLNEEASRAFSLRLLARVLFCKFLERKGLIPSSIWDTSLSEHYYYHEVLEPLFFGTLNTPKSERNYGLLDSKITHLLDSIPYLNGGLFSPQENDFYDPKSPQAYINTLQVPTTILKELFKELDKFHFTLDESTPIDQEVGLDPEMLGMVFENLLSMLFTDHKIDNLSSLRKQTGSYYTPREIVSYMAKSCILEYLKTHTTISDSSLRSLVFEYEHEFGYQEILSLLTALSGFRVLDPACGSGAFPMGILQELTQILEALDEEGTAFMALQSQEFKASHQDKDPRYIRKLHILQNNIYGVDIQPMATEISRLRCFLSLICDEDKNKIEPLPNLEFKFLTANSLLPLTQEKQLNYAGFTTDMKQIQAIRQDFLLASTQEKDKLKVSYLKLRDKIAKETFATSIAEDNPLLNYNPFDSQSKAEFFDPVFMFGVEKFDCVIGNPPYVQVKKGIFPSETYPYSEGQDKGKQNLYKVFIEHAYNSIASDGIFSLIVSHSIMCDLSASFTRKMLLTQTTIHEVIEFPKKAQTKEAQVFKSGLQGTCIVTATKTRPNNHAFKLSIHNDKITIKNPIFETIAQNKILECYPKNYEIPLVKAGDFSLVEKLKGGDKILLKNMLEGSLQGNINTIHLKDIESQKETDALLAKGEDCHQYNLELNKRFAIPTHPLVIKAIETNLNQNIIVLQGITGTTDKIRIHATLLESKNTKIVFLHSVKILFLQNVREAKFILGLLNSKVLDWLFRKTSSNNNVNSYELEALPIPKIDSANQSIADKIIALVEEILALKKQDSATDTTKLESQINALVYTLYNLTDEEIELIEKG